MTGRPTLCTPEVVNEIADAIKGGMSYEDAAALAGISRATLQNWKARAKAENERLQEKGARIRKKEQVFVDFLDTLKRAELEGKQYLLTIIANAGKKQWQASAWLLERRYPDEYGRRQRVDIPDKVKVEVSGESSERLTSIISGLLAARESDGVENGAGIGGDSS